MRLRDKNMTRRAMRLIAEQHGPEVKTPNSPVKLFVLLNIILRTVYYNNNI